MEWQVNLQSIFSMTTFIRERWTKWDVVCMMSRELNLPMDHVTEVKNFSTNFSSTVKFLKFQFR